MSRYSFSDPCAFYSRSYYAPSWCDLCKSSNHDINLCLYYGCYPELDFASPMGNIDVVLALHDPSFPLAQCTVLKVDEPFGFDVTFDFFDACFKSKDILDEVHGLAETPLEVSRDVFMNEESPSLGFDNNILPNPLDHSHVSPICSLHSPSPEYYIDMPIENPMIFYANNDLGYEDNMFSMLGGNVDNFMSLCYFSWYKCLP